MFLRGTTGTVGTCWNYVGLNDVGLRWFRRVKPYTKLETLCFDNTMLLRTSVREADLGQDSTTAYRTTAAQREMVKTES